jgi:PII-like signaling protein
MNRVVFEEDDVLLRIYMSEDSRHHHGHPLYEAVVLKARELGLAGATVLRGVLGFGADRRLHTSKLVDLMEDLPVVVEIVDTAENIAKLRPFLDEVLDKAFVTAENVHVVKYRHEDKKKELGSKA